MAFAASLYVLRAGIPWRLIPKDLPPKSTVFDYFSRWRDAGVLQTINHHLVMAAVCIETRQAIHPVPSRHKEHTRLQRTAQQPLPSASRGWIRP